MPKTIVEKIADSFRGCRLNEIQVRTIMESLIEASSEASVLKATLDIAKIPYKETKIIQIYNVGQVEVRPMGEVSTLDT